MKNNQYYMKVALEEALLSHKNGGVAIGSVLVDSTSDKVISRGASKVKITHDPTAHAEINCIRQAASQLQSDDLFGFVLFSTLEPCHMCLSAAAWARISHLYFGAYKKDVDSNLFDIKGDFSDENEGKRMNLRENISMEVQGGILENECAAVLKGYRDPSRHQT